MLIALGLALMLVSAASPEPELLPAYAHNDYGNPRPLAAALDLGYRGAEVDVFLVNGELLVGHDRDELVAGRTLERLYLAPLEILRQSRGKILADASPFLLTVEAKEPGVETYAAIRRALSAYPELVRRWGPEVPPNPPPVEVVHVGWHPPLEALAGATERLTAIQVHAAELPAEPASLPRHLVPLVTQDYRDVFRWRGAGEMPPHEKYRLAVLVERAHAVPGRRLRIIHGPVDVAVYRTLMEAGVDLIGTRTLERSKSYLHEVRDAWPPVTPWADTTPPPLRSDPQ